MSKSERIKGKISLVLNDSMEGKELVKLKQQHNCDYQVQFNNLNYYCNALDYYITGKCNVITVIVCETLCCFLQHHIKSLYTDRVDDRVVESCYP